LAKQKVFVYLRPDFGKERAGL